ncbi:MAG: HAD family phosphatase [Deltaproteobacteria bacterium]|nr:HAD family phosphatase [Deltaproteobacteria bacterium]
MQRIRLRGLFADLDGTLAQSLHFMRRVYHDFLIRYGAKGDDREFDELNGPPLTQVVARLKDRHGLSPSLTELVRHYHQMIITDYARQAAPAPGAERLLSWARQKLLYTAVVTSAPGGIAKDFLNYHKLDDYVDLVIGVEDVSRGKPSPEPYLTALARLGINSAAALAVEDSATGVKSAGTAGIFVIGVAGPTHHKELLAAGAGRIVSHLEEIPNLAEELWPT